LASFFHIFSCWSVNWFSFALPPPPQFFTWLYHITFLFYIPCITKHNGDQNFGKPNVVLICCYLSCFADAMGSSRLLRQTWMGIMQIIQISDAHTWAELFLIHFYICFPNHI
jgi:hypothetical protein